MIERLLAAVGVTDPIAVYLVLCFALVGVGWAVIALARAYFRWAQGARAERTVVTQFLEYSAELVLNAIAEQLDQLDPKSQEAAVKDAAAEAYDCLPDVVYVAVKGRTVPVPVKMVVTKAMFCDLVLAVYRGVEGAYNSFHAAFDDAYAGWRRAGKPTEGCALRLSR